MPIFYNLIYRFGAIPLKIPAGFPVNIDKLILKCRWKYKGPRITKTILRDESLNSYSKQDRVALAKKKHRESPETVPHILAQLICSRDDSGEITIFSTNGAGTSGYPHEKLYKLTLTSHHTHTN